MTQVSPHPAALILAGGLGLGAYQLGVVEALLGSGQLRFDVVAGTSIGAFNTALIAGGPPEDAATRLSEFWRRIAQAPAPWQPWLGATQDPVRHASNWLHVAGARLGGVPNFFHPNLGQGETGVPTSSLYAADSVRRTLAELVDFDRLNDGRIRVCIAALDLATGAPVVFDTAEGDTLTIEHLLASGAMLPAFKPVEIAGRVLADGGLAANAALEPLLATDRRHAVPPLLVLADLFAPDDRIPASLSEGAARANDVQFAAQTTLRLAGLQREWALAAHLPGRVEGDGADLFHLSYRPLPAEAGPEKTYDFSQETLANRAAEGRADAELMLAQLDTLASGPGLRVHPVRR